MMWRRAFRNTGNFLSIRLNVAGQKLFDGFVAQPAISRERSCSIAARAVFRGAFGQKTDFTPHCLRDTFAVSLLQKGVPLEEVSKLLGSESIKTTEKSYAKWVQGTFRQIRQPSFVVKLGDGFEAAFRLCLRAVEDRRIGTNALCI
jgi:integrase